MTDEAAGRTRVSGALGARLWDAAGGALALALLIHGMRLHRRFLHDDAVISLRCARSLAEHGALVWNPGERAEGCTGLLHVPASAGLLRLGLEPVAALRLLGAAGALGLLAAVFLALRRVLPPDGAAPARAAALVTLAACPTVPIWAVGGLETIPAAALLAAGMAALVPAFAAPPRARGALVAGLAFAAAALIRPDSLVFAAGCAGALALAAPAPGRARLGAAALALGPGAAALALQGLWRLSCCGALPPLPFHAGTGVPAELRLAHLPRVLEDSLAEAPLALLAPALLAVALLRAPRPRWLALAAAPVAAQGGWILWMGGDHMPGARPFAPLLAPGALLLATALRAPPAALRGPAAVVTLLLAFGLALTDRPMGMDGADFSGRIVGRDAEARWPRNRLIAADATGGLAVKAARRRFRDMPGLDGPRIARRDPGSSLHAPAAPSRPCRGRRAHALPRRADAIIPGPAQGATPERPMFLSDAERADLPGLLRCRDKRPTPIAGAPTGPGPVRRGRARRS
jgi:hypothetical protein